MKIDVTIATKNNEDTIEKCIKSIKDNIPYNEIILIDDSDDKTPEIAERLGAKVFHRKALLGEKRFLQAKFSNTEWIASIDSDVFVYDNWWVSMSKHISENVGIIAACLEGSIKKYNPEFDHFSKWVSYNEFKTNNKTSTIGNNLVRREMILSCTSLKNVHVGEDVLIANHIVKKGYKCVVNKNITGLHYHSSPLEHLKMSYRRVGKDLRHTSKFKLITNSLAIPIITIYRWISYAFHTSKLNINLLCFMFSLYIELLKGSLKK